MKRKSKKGQPELFAQEETKFLEYMRAAEGEGPQTTLFELLASDGVSLPEPADLDDSEITEKLWEVIHGIYNHRAVLTFTDHLSDRELYTKLFQEILHEDHPIFPKGFAVATHIDVLGYDWSDEDVNTYLKYYADEETRERYARDFKMTLPERAESPFPRDHLLPG